MARFEIRGLDEAIDELARMGQLTGQVADAMLLAGAEEVRKAWTASAQRHGHIDKGDMISSIGYAGSPRSVSDVRTIDIYPQGKDRRGIRNAEKAFILHYGTSSIKASAWVDEADRESETTAPSAMLAVFDGFIKTGKVPAVGAPGRRAGRTGGK